MLRQAVYYDVLYVNSTFPPLVPEPMTLNRILLIFGLKTMLMQVFSNSCIKAATALSHDTVQNGFKF